MLTPDILYLDNHVLVAFKPAGMITQPNETGQLSLEEWAKQQVKERFNKPGAVFLHALHRLDKPVAGLVLFARTSKALSRLNVSMRSKQTSKIYLAKVEGVLKSSEGSLEHYLLHGDHRAELSSKQNPAAKIARLRYRTIKADKKYTWLEIELDTGRYHQIRIQLATIGHPIVGDLRYGSKESLAGGIIALQHSHFEFPHPISGEIVKVDVKEENSKFF